MFISKQIGLLKNIKMLPKMKSPALVNRMFQWQIFVHRGRWSTSHVTVCDTQLVTICVAKTKYHTLTTRSSITLTRTVADGYIGKPRCTLMQEQLQQKLLS